MEVKTKFQAGQRIYYTAKTQYSAQLSVDLIGNIIITHRAYHNADGVIVDIYNDIEYVTENGFKVPEREAFTSAQDWCDYQLKHVAEFEERIPKFSKDRKIVIE